MEESHVAWGITSEARQRMKGKTLTLVKALRIGVAAEGKERVI
jgi:hypothetical protein